jgi:hypothetical protein
MELQQLETRSSTKGVLYMEKNRGIIEELMVLQQLETWSSSKGMLFMEKNTGIIAELTVMHIETRNSSKGVPLTQKETDKTLRTDLTVVVFQAKHKDQACIQTDKEETDKEETDMEETDKEETDKTPLRTQLVVWE